MRSTGSSIFRNRTRNISAIAAILALLLFAGVTPSHGYLVTNGGFETGDFSGWTTSNAAWTSIISGGYSGDYAAALAENGQTGSLFQTVATVPGQEYLLNYWLYNSGGSDVNQFETIVDGVALGSLANLPYQVYTEYSYPFTATSQTTTLLFNERNDYPGNFYLDDVSINPVPEPVTILLIGSGMLMGFGLRRKKIAS